MYIGPWQEFHLNKARHNNINNNNKSENEKNKIIHQNLITILENSLDPEAAKQAIQAINPYLEDVSDSNNNNKSEKSTTSGTHLPQIPRNQRGRSYRHIRRSNERRYNSKHYNQALPLILSARNSYEGNGPLSTRSTMSSSSEPIHGTVYTPDKNEMTKSHTPVELKEEQRDNKQIYSNGYDNSNVMDILKIERNEQKNSEKNTITKGFSSYWKWKEEGKPIPQSFIDSKEKKIKLKRKKSSSSSNKDAQDIDKLERMNKLKEIYSNINKNEESYDYGASELKQSPSRNHQLQLSPIRSPRARSNYSKPCTPVVHDKDLTDLDMAVVSKYFNKNHREYASSALQRRRVRTPSPSPSGVSTQRFSFDPKNASRGRSDIVKTPIRREKVSQKDNVSTENASTNSVTIDSSNVEMSNVKKRDDDTGVYGEEGLLDWCTNLDINDIDNMF